MYESFYNKLDSERKRWERYSGSKIYPLSNAPLDVLQNRHLIRHYTSTFALVDMLDARDPYTARHSQRVAQMCLRLAFMMRLPKSKIPSAFIAAGLHDIGKVGIPDRVLLKKEALNFDEYEIIQRHPGIGSDILLKIRGFEEIAAGVRHHHERWDGNGYPDKLAVSNIPLFARMIAICDSIDAMRSDRPYRKGMADSDCYSEVEKNDGIMYNPEIVPQCLKNWDYFTGDLYSSEQ